MRAMKTKADELALLGKPIDAEDLIEQILAGLPEDYKPEVDAVNSRDHSISFSELTEKLLSREAMLMYEQPMTPSFPVTANPATRTTRGSWRPSFMPHNNNNSRDAPRPSRHYLDKCQACGTQGHRVQRCPSFSVVAKTTFVPQQASQFAPSTTLQWRPSAHPTVLNHTHQDSWLMDSGATHHVTSDLSNLSLYALYSGNDSIVIGNGSSLPITHTGSTSFTLPSRTLYLDNVLYAPSMQKNLISVQKICDTNRASVKFFPSMFQVNDLRTGTPVLTAPVKDGAYEWPIDPPRAPLALSASKSPIFYWHHRLGHPAFPILKVVSSIIFPFFMFSF